MKSQNAVRLIRELDAEINEIESDLQTMMDALHSFITTIPGMGLRMGTMILAEIGGLPTFIPQISSWPLPELLPQQPLGPLWVFALLHIFQPSVFPQSCQFRVQLFNRNLSFMSLHIPLGVKLSRWSAFRYTHKKGRFWNPSKQKRSRPVEKSAKRLPRY